MVVRPLTCAALVAATLVLAPAPAQAASRVDVSGADGRAAVAAEGSTTLTVRGSGFQSVKGGHGGIYVMFGTVEGAWQPSRGSGSYAYVADSESRANAGRQRFVAFPGSDTADEANGGTISASGAWSTTLVVPGATFTAVNRRGESVQVDCRVERCGVITIGAHGVTNANNETFTPVSVVAGTSGTSGSSGAATTSSPASRPAARTARPTLTVDRATAVAGRVMSFAATGLTPGQQVTATLDDGVAAVGPLTVGEAGTLAGVLALPADLSGGTHTLRLTGAARLPSLSLAVQPADVAPATEPVAEQDEAAAPWLPVAFATLAAAVFVGSLAWRGVRMLRTRRVETADA